jgi:ABC-type uncharacterized transport system substrate-binding protein
MKRMTTRWFSIVAIAAIFGWIFVSSLSKPRILVLHSQAEDSVFSVDAQKGIEEALSANRRPLYVTHHFMDLEHAYSKTQRRTAVASARRAIDKLDPDILIAFGDQSNELVASQLDLQTRPAIVYSAILAPEQAYGYSPQTRATGVEENIPMRTILDLFDAMMPGKPLKIAIIGVRDITDPIELDRYVQANWTYHSLIGYKLISTMKEWESFVRQDAANADILLVLDARMVQSTGPDSFLPEAEVIAWTQENSNALPIGLHVSYAANGGGLTVSPPASAYGKLSMQMALKWLNAGLGSAPPPSETLSSFDLTVRLSALRKLDITIPRLYLDFAEATGGLYP